MNENQNKLFILNLSKKECEKLRDKNEKQVKKISDRLFEMNDSNSTVRKRSMERVKLDCACEERDRWSDRVDLINEWIEGLKSCNEQHNNLAKERKW